MHTTSVTLLMRLGVKEDRPAWERFVSLYTPLMLYWVRRVGLSEHDGADLVQEIFLLLLDKLAGFQHRGPGSFRAWLRTVTVNKTREVLRRKRLPAAGDDGQMLDALVTADSDQFWEVEYRQQLVARALTVMKNEFEPATWQACWQRVVEDRPASEVARNLGLSEAAVYVYTGRVLRRLRKELQDLLD